ncbi:MULTISPECIES: DNA-formamidopyrimidine glycosylase family protein [unclassified Rhodococcus (in: high G+C Gram-positive bacteria)]|uniref:DNA-formamidopyrimidine glycosylase family protein n=1 Tax=unclassified Rhodococcus (in: high G+C Gram-positive bacteria) TaxID=192944 RepID=UPI0009284F03|nr:DNA-formamidopyrimidine glycosylase family protein [Rhodococcus sp. M8]OLL16716.1 DNA glycosylase [Rhodococcus sp. M8]QPG46791.1 Fpg/Nei family DNA glycosylase [Rhodococcus sp. M8]
MPEGDTVFQAATRLRRALAGKPLTRCDIRVPRYATVDLTGTVVDEVLARGKHLLVRVGAHTLHTHLKMEGVWDVHAPGTRWRRQGYHARIVLAVADAEAVGFDLGIVEVLDRDREEEAVGHLGPDLLGPDWDPAAAAANLMRDPGRPVGLALLDQRVMAGVGNVYRCELCFLRGVHPSTPVADAGEAAAWVDLAHRLLVFNRDRVSRITTGDRRPGRGTWVYGRAGKPCRRCGTTIRTGMLGSASDPDRKIDWCPHCQPRDGDG